MSWDLFVQDWGDAKSLADIPVDFNPKSIGKRSEMIEKMIEAEPSIDFSDSSWGRLKNEHFSIEFNMGNGENLDSFTMHIRGSELAIPCIDHILSKLKLKASDGSSTSFFDSKTSKEEIEKWIDFRKKILIK